MALRTIGYIDTDDFSGLEAIDRQIASFKTGERGQISIPLDRDIAVSEEYSNFQRGANSMNGELVSQGLRPWPGETKIVILDWRNRMVYIKFAVSGYGGFSYTPSALVGMLAKLTASAAGQFTKGAARTQFQQLARRTGTRIATSARGRAAHAAVLRSARTTYKEGLKAARRTGGYVLPRLALLAAGGAIIFFAVGRVITIFKEVVIDPALGAIEDVKKKVEAGTDWFKENMDKVAIGVVAGVLVIGGLMMARK
jgi:hypothetical protein